jgi:hypothetical protein
MAAGEALFVTGLLGLSRQSLDHGIVCSAARLDWKVVAHLQLARLHL